MRDIDSNPLLTERSKEFLRSVAETPTMPVDCVFGDGPAVVFRQLRLGCVALPGVVEQPLCLQHDMSRMPLGEDEDPGNDVCVLDLSLGGQYSQQYGGSPLFVIDATKQLSYVRQND